MSKSVPKRLIAILCFPFFLLLLPFVALGVGILFVHGSILGLVQRVRWLRGLRKDNRVLAAAELLSTVNEGTLIVDRPGLNFKSSLCWWTSENVLELCPASIPTDEQRIELLQGNSGPSAHEFDEWCWQRYLAPDSGKATLVAPAHHGEAMAAELLKRLPNLIVVKSWSAAAVPKPNESDNAA